LAVRVETETAKHLEIPVIGNSYFGV